LTAVVHLLAQDLTHTGNWLGCPPYMSPEQGRDSTRVGPAADVYSLGATLYHLLAGRPPFQAATVEATLQQVLNEEPVSPRRLNSAVDRDLEVITLKCSSLP
jgi:serine/threonine protein kinase